MRAGRAWLVVSWACTLWACAWWAAAAAAAELYDSALHEAVLDDELCDQHLEELSSFLLYDSSFRIPQNLLEGNFVSWGNFHQCLSLGAGAGAGEPRGKHCVLWVNAASVPSLPSLPSLPWLQSLSLHELNATWTPQRLLQYRRKENALALQGYNAERSAVSVGLPPLQLGVCVPAACSARRALASYLHTPLLDLQYEEFCRLPGDRPYAPADYVAIVAFSLIGLVTLLSTGYELYYRFVRKEEGLAASPWAWCSLLRNGRAVLRAGGGGSLRCLDGIRAISILWVILGHSLIKMALSNFVNVFEAFETWFGSERALYITSANISVDTFFMLSGLLTVYTTANKLTQKSLVRNLHLFYLNRLLRMFPLLGAAVLLQAGPLHRAADGANWPVASSQVQFCRDHWWAALLHIQNYHNPQAECLPHSWYLSVDVQLHVLSPLVLVWLLGGRRGARAAAVASALLSAAASTIFCFVTGMATTGFALPESRGAYYYRWFYVNTLTRAPVFVIGMAFGYLLHEHRKTRLRIPKAGVWALWAAAAGLAACVLLMFHASNPEPESQLLASLINAVQRPAWAVALGLVIVACVHGYGGPVNWFLSLPAWQFISRISYAMYIFHYPMMWVGAGAAFAPIYFSVGRLWLHFMADMALTVLVSVAAAIVIDTPFASLQKKLLSGRGGPPKPKPSPAEPEQKDSVVVVSLPRLPGKEL